MDLLKITEPDDFFVLESLHPDSFVEPLVTSPFTLRTAFSELLDITTPPKPELLEVSDLNSLFYLRLTLNRYSPTLPTTRTKNWHYIILLKAKLSIYARKLHISRFYSSRYETWIEHHYPTVPEVLKLFTTLSLPVPLLLEKLPRQQPRFYSISSSPQIHPSQIHLTVSVVQYPYSFQEIKLFYPQRYTTPSGKPHFGVASNFLARAKAGASIRVFVRHADFGLPPPSSSSPIPIIMVGPGTGIAPFRGFWHELALNKVSIVSRFYDTIDVYMN